MEIKINCKTGFDADLNKLVDIQGGLREATGETRKKLKSSIIAQGLLAPLFIWEDENGNYCIIDGNQRASVLRELVGAGDYELGRVPIVRIQANDIGDAKRKLLALVSQYGEFEVGELNIWLKELGAYDFYEFAGVDLDFPDPEEVVKENVYEAKQDPEFGSRFYEEGDIKSKEEELDSRVENRSNKKYVEVVCHNCGRAFSFIGPDKGGRK